MNANHSKSCVYYDADKERLWDFLKKRYVPKGGIVDENNYKISFSAVEFEIQANPVTDLPINYE
jgi:hypothetical protein